MKNKRIHWIDIAKGIGIIFIIYAHVLGPNDLRYLFYAFHIPLFLFLSGIVFKPYSNFKIFLTKSIKGLLLPYFIIGFLSYVLWLFNTSSINHIGYYEISEFISLFYGNSNNNWMIFNNLLWFLPTLFVTRMIFYLINKIAKNDIFKVLILMIFSIAGYLYSISLQFLNLPFGAETAISAVVFYGAGFLWIKSEKAKNIIAKYKLVIFPVFVIATGIISTIEFNIYGRQIDMRLLHLNNYFSFYLDAFMGIFAWISLSIILNKNRLLEYIGKNSLILFAWQSVLFYYFDSVRDIILSKQMYSQVKTILPSVYTVATLIIILPIYEIYKKCGLFFKLFPKPHSQ